MRHLEDPHLRPTAILDYQSERVQEAISQLPGASQTPLDYLRAAHRFLQANVAPVYTVDELQPTSITLMKRKGSCSQRFACLESFARARGIPTRVRGLWIAGRFWARRFRFTRPFIPRRILLVWPQFQVDGEWLSVEKLFGSLDLLAQQNPRAFANDSEALFDAIEHTAVDFDGETKVCSEAHCDLSRFALDDAGLFASRDELFRTYRPFQRTIRGVGFEAIFGGRKSS